MRILKDSGARAWLAVLARCYAPAKYTLLAALALSGLSAALSAVSPLITRAIFDQALPARDTRLLLWLGIGWAIALAATSVTAFLYGYLVTKADCDATSRLRTRVFNACMLKLSASGDTGRSHGDWLSRIVRDPEALVAEAGARPVLSSAAHVFALVLACGVAFYLDWLLAVVSLSIGVVTVLFQTRSPRVIKESSRALSATRAQVTGRIENLLAAWRTIVRHGRTSDETRFADNEFGRLAISQIGTQKQKYVASLRVSLLLQSGPVILVIVAVGRMMAGDMTLGTLIAFFSYAAMINSSMKGIFTDVLRLSSGYGQTMECVSLVSGSGSGEDACGSDAPTGSAVGTCVGETHISDLAVAAGEHMVTADRLVFHAGHTYLVTGDSGAGKSVFLEFLAGLRGCVRGEIVVNGRRYEPAEYMCYAKSYGLVMKDEVLLDRAVMDNVTYGVSGRADGDWCSWLATLRMDYADRPDTNGLSAGEKQRVSFVRELLRKPPVFIIDEGLDSLEQNLGRDALLLMRRVLPSSVLIICTHNWRQQLPVDDALTVCDGSVVQQRYRAADTAALGQARI